MPIDMSYSMKIGWRRNPPRSLINLKTLIKSNYLQNQI